MIQRLLWTAFILTGLLVVVSCDNSTPTGGTNEILIGHVASLTGDTATFGKSADEGIKLAEEEINAAGGVLGKKVRVIPEDDRSVGDEAKTAASKLITRDHVCAILGEISSSRSIAMAPVCEDARVPMLSPGSTNPKVTVNDDGSVKQFVFRNCFTDKFQGDAIAAFACRAKPDGLGLKRFAILYPVNSDYGVGLRDYVKAGVASRGGEIVSEVAYTEKTDTDFKAQLTKIKSANPDAIFVTGYYTEGGLIAQQARDLGLNIPLLAGDGWDSDQTLTIGGKAVNGCYFSNHYSPDEDRPEVKKFVESYKKKFNGRVPDAMAILGYDAMKIMADAVQRSGGTDPMRIRDALATTTDFPGASGKTTINQLHNADKPIVIIKIEDGQFKFAAKVNPEPAAPTTTTAAIP